MGLSLAAGGLLGSRAAAAPVDPQASGVARYRVTLLSVTPLRFAVRAELPIGGDSLEMDDSYPAELPQMAAKGWPALISGLAVRDASGNAVAATVSGNKGWKLARAVRGRITLDYITDYSLFAAAGWSSPLESAIVDEEHIAVIGRSLFIGAGQAASAEVDFDIPPVWRPVMPWLRRSPGANRYAVKTAADLTDNMLVFSKAEPDVVTAAGFTLQITTMGHWKPLRPLVRSILGTVIRREVALMGYSRREVYNVVLVPIVDEGGEAYRQSFVYCYANPTAENRAVWANTLAHEIFHYWNYARLKGADYASTQWFQEGFTEYVANLTLVCGGIVSLDGFLAKLSEHLANARRLTTTLVAIGTHKGPPLYSAGALTAFCWDVMIHQASGGRRNLGDFFRNLWRRTDEGARKYDWSDIRAALKATADADWEGFYQAYIKGHDPLPLDRVLPLAGLRLEHPQSPTPTIALDPGAPAEAMALLRRLTTGR